MRMRRFEADVRVEGEGKRRLIPPEDGAFCMDLPVGVYRDLQIDRDGTEEFRGGFCNDSVRLCLEFPGGGDVEPGAGGYRREDEGYPPPAGDGFVLRAMPHASSAPAGDKSSPSPGTGSTGTSLRIAATAVFRSKPATCR